MSSFEPIARCEARLVDRWDTATAAAKHYADVSNVTVIRFGRDVERVEFVPAHTVERDGRTEVWKNRIALVLRPSVTTEFHYRRLDERDAHVDRYEAEDASIGVVDDHSPATVEAFIAAITDLVNDCRYKAGERAAAPDDFR